MVYLVFNNFINAILTLWPNTFGVDLSQGAENLTGVKEIAGITTLDTNVIGAIVISSIVIWIHNRFYSKKLPEMLGIFQGLAFVVIIGFFVMIPFAFLVAFVWPYVQQGIGSLQGIMTSAGYLGVWLYHFLERVLIPTGLHHFVNIPFEFGPAAVSEGLRVYWMENLTDFSASTAPLNELYPYGFIMHGNIKMFGSLGIALAMYYSTPKENRKKVLALVLPVTLTAIFAGITEPLEFTFLFIAPYLFVLHALIGATIVTVMNMFGVVGMMGGGMIEIASFNWIPLFSNHGGVYIIEIIIGLIFSAIYFVLFRWLIIKFDIPLPGRKNDSGDKLYTKADYQAAKEGSKNSVSDDEETETFESEYEEKAVYYLKGLGGKENIKDVNNCATRLRITVHDPDLVEENAYFTDRQMSHGIAKSGQSMQIIVGLSVPQVREEFEGKL